MKTKRSTLINCIAATFAALFLTACGSDSGDGGSGSSGLSLNITDAPVLNEDIAEVWVRFTRVIIHPSDGSDDIDEPVTDGTNPWIDINLRLFRIISG